MAVRARAVVVTGVSKGLGNAIAAALIHSGLHVFGSVRTQSDADRLLSTFGDQKFTPLLFDVSDPAAVNRAAALVRRQLGNQKLLGLVNNAGVGDPGPAELIPLDIAKEVIDINLIGVLIVCQAFIPLLGSDTSLQGPPGRIVQISSLGSVACLPMHSVYAASKAGLDALTDSMRRELVDAYGIKVALIVPGSMLTSDYQTKMQRQARQYDDTAYRKFVRFFTKHVENSRDPKNCTPLDTVTGMVHSALTARSPRLTYYPMSWPQYLMLLFFMFAPRWLTDTLWRMLTRSS